MTYEEVKIGGEMHVFIKDETVEGEVKEIRENVGPNNSMVYLVGDKQFWGTSALDLLMSSIKVGNKVKITLIDDKHKFPSGRVGRNFKVEVDK